jgi:hypothetical protein
MSIKCVLYVVKAGNGRIHVRDGCFGAETVGDAGWLEGRGPTLMMRNEKEKTCRRKDKKRQNDRSFSKSVIDRRRGTTSRTHERPNFTGRFVGRRVHRAA